MIDSKVIIIGGGPAGSSCGWRLRQLGFDCLILDKKEFPRTKLCAGWVTPQVFKNLEINVNDYPHSLTEFNKFKIHIYNKEMEINVRQYAVRRYEFDDWLLNRSGVSVMTHEVRDIEKEGDDYIIDGLYRCRYIVGAGGTHCPAYRRLFKNINPRAKGRLVLTLEEEFPYDYQDENCHLWFLHNKLPGYSWYVPKNNGYLNIGIGGFSEKLKANQDSIKKQWQLFTKELEKQSLVKNHRFNARGYVYYLRDGMDMVQNDRSFLIGDAAGLATRDMGEGIGPAVMSGILSADAIAFRRTFSVRSVQKNSFPKYRTFARLLFAYMLNPKAKAS